GGLFDAEITHAAYLPPHVSGASVYTGKVFFMCGRGCCFPSPGYCDTSGTRVFRWDPLNPRQQAVQITVPNNPGTQPTQAFFCSGHAFLQTGDWVVVGGTDYQTSGASCGCPFGSFGVSMWNASPTGPAPLQWLSLAMMPSRRWYPIVTELGTTDG